jgi:cell division protein ZapE
MSVSEIYQQELKTRGFHSDPAQLRAVEALDDCAKAWAGYKHKRANAIKKLINHPDIPQGVYLFGGRQGKKLFDGLLLPSRSD